MAKMNYSLKLLLIVSTVICILMAFAYFYFTNIDFVGNKNPKIIKENLNRNKNMILEASYRNGTDYCRINLLDSINIEINTGNKFGSVILNETYTSIGDTIIINGAIEDLKKYSIQNKLLIQKKKILFRLDSLGKYDSTISMNVIFKK